MPNRGFTLIEILVVAAIISLLTSIALVSLEQARNRAKDSAVRAEVIQLRTLLAREMADNGSYAPLKGMSGSGGGWFRLTTQCLSNTNNITGTYAQEAKNICAAIIKAQQGGTACPQNGQRCLLLNGAEAAGANRFSIVAWLPGEKKFLCMGSSGNQSLSLVNGNEYGSEPGCPPNP